jgi:hypothetical protein
MEASEIRATTKTQHPASSHSGVVSADEPPARRDVVVEAGADIFQDRCPREEMRGNSARRGGVMMYRRFGSIHQGDRRRQRVGPLQPGPGAKLVASRQQLQLRICDAPPLPAAAAAPSFAAGQHGLQLCGAVHLRLAAHTEALAPPAPRGPPRHIAGANRKPGALHPGPSATVRHSQPLLLPSSRACPLLQPPYCSHRTAHWAGSSSNTVYCSCLYWLCPIRAGMQASAALRAA